MRIWECTKCGEQFDSKDGMEYWLSLNKMTPNPHGYLCPMCEAKFKEWVKQ